MKPVRKLSLVVAMALSLVAIQAGMGGAAALATDADFRSEAYPATYKGQQKSFAELTYSVPGSDPSGRIECGTHDISGSLSSAASTVSLTPSFAKCQLLGIGATVNTNGCKYVIHVTGESAPYSGTMDLACAKEGGAIEVASAVCKVQIPAQSGLGTVSLSNTGEGRSRAIAATFNLSGLKYIYVPGCSKTPGAYENGALKGPITIKGLNQQQTYAQGAYLADEQIEDPRFVRGEEYPLAVEGQAAKPRFVVNIGTFDCGTSYLNYMINGPSAGLSMTPGIIGCSLAGTGVQVKNNGCVFTYTLAGEVAGKSRVGLACPVGATMELTWSTCVMRISPQEWTSAAAVENTGSGATRGVTLKTSVTTMKYEATNCPGGSGTFTNGGFYADWQLKASQAAGVQRGLWIE